MDQWQALRIPLLSSLVGFSKLIRKGVVPSPQLNRSNQRSFFDFGKFCWRVVLQSSPGYWYKLRMISQDLFTQKHPHERRADGQLWWAARTREGKPGCACPTPVLPDQAGCAQSPGHWEMAQHGKTKSILTLAPP